MENQKFVAYYRVSTEGQGDDDGVTQNDSKGKKKSRGLGMSAQKLAVERYIKDRGELIGSFSEIESGRKTDRTALNEALRVCRLRRATLIVAKLDRLSRNSEFLLKVVRESGDRGVVFCDLPEVPPGEVGKMFLTMMAGIAAVEAEAISRRTKAALGVLKTRGVKLGAKDGRIVPFARVGGLASVAKRREKARQRALDLLPVIEEIRAEGITTLKAIAKALNERGHSAPRGGRWFPTSVSYVLRHAPVEEVAA